MTEQRQDVTTRRAVLAGSVLSASAAALTGVPASASDATPRPAAGSPVRSFPGPHKIVRSIPRPAPELLQRLRAGSAASPVALAGPLVLGNGISVDPSIRAIRSGMRVLGPAFTVQAPDHLMPMYAMELMQPGDVLVIDAGGPARYGIWGGSMTRSSVIRKAAGVIIDGMVCDSTVFSNENVKPEWGTPVFCRGAAPGYTTWEKPGSVNVPVTLGTTTVEPGDLIVAGDDGVAVVPRATIKEGVERAIWFMEEAKNVWWPGLSQGKTWFNVLGLEATIKKLGIPEQPA